MSNKRNFDINKYDKLNCTEYKMQDYDIKQLTMSIHTPTSELNINTYLLLNRDSAIIFDASYPLDEVKKALDGKSVKAIILTHAHWDHILSLVDFMEDFKCPIYIHKNSKNRFLDSHINCSDTHDLELVFPIKSTAKIFEFNNDSGQINIEDFEIKYYYTPGHSDDSMSYIIGNNLFCGDSLRMHKQARTNLPTSDLNALQKTTQFYNTFDKNMMVFNGHENPDYLKNTFAVKNLDLDETIIKTNK